MGTISQMQIKIGADSSGLKKELSGTQKAITDAFNVDPMEKASTAIGGVSKKTSELIGRFATLTSAAAGAFGMASLIDNAVQAGDSLYKLSNKFNLTTAEAGSLSRVLKLTGGDTDTFATAMLRLDKSFSASGSAGDKVRNTLDTFGVSLTDSSGKLLPLNTQLANLANGYKMASDAGLQQEFIMNTLGAKGMSLVQTLEEYSSAAETAGKVKGIGIDANQMHELAMSMKVMQMQSQQVQLAFTAALAPVAEQVFPQIISGLTQTAVYLFENKERIKDIAGEVVAMIAVYKTAQTAMALGSGVKTIWETAAADAQKSMTVQNAAQAESLAAHEKSVARKIADIERQAAREQAAVIKSAAKQKLSAEETARYIVAECTKIELKAAETAEYVRTAMTASFQASAAKAVTAAEQTTAALTGVGIAATETAAKIEMAHTGAAESAQVAVGAERELGIALAATGTEAVIAGEKNVAAKTSGTIATAEQTAATTGLAIATVGAGDAAAVTGAKTLSAMTIAGTAVKNLTKAVWLLAGGWYGVAAAVAYVGYTKYQQIKKEDEERRNHTYNVNGKTVIERDGTFYHVQPTVTDTSSATEDGSVDIVETELTDPQELEEANRQYNERYQNDPEYLAKLQKEEAEAKQKELEEKQKELIAKMQSGMGGGSSTPASAGSAIKEQAPKLQEIELPIGEKVHEWLDSINEGNDWTDYSHGKNDKDGWCDSFVAEAYKQTGISQIGGISTDGTINDKAFKNANAYHYANDGYEPKNGDYVDFAGHAAIYEDGMIVSRQSKGGKRTITREQAEADFGKIQGYGSLAEATGDMTYKASVDSSGKAASEAAKKLIKAKNDAQQLFSQMSNTVLENNSTEYENELRKVDTDVKAKENKIIKLQTQGIDVTALQKELGEYQSTLKQKVVDKWSEANTELKNSTAATMATVTSEYKRAAEVEYKATLDKLTKERKEKEKAVMQDKNDAVGRKAVDDWYNAEVLKAHKKLDADIRTAHNKTMNDLIEAGDVLGAYKATNSTAEQDSVNLEGQQNLAKEHEKLWRIAHQSIAGYIAMTADDLYGTLSDSMAEFVKGTKSAMDVVHDFGNQVLSTIAKIAAQRAASNIVDSLLGSFIKGNDPTAGINKEYGTNISWIDTTFKRADGGELPGYAQGGGLISGAGTGTSDSILAYLERTGQFVRLSDGEYVMTAAATAKNRMTLEAMNAGAFAGGGYMTAPSISSNYGSPNYSRGNGLGMNVAVNITNNGNSDVSVKDSHYDADIGSYVLDIVVDAASRNKAGFRSNMQTALGVR